MPSPTPIVGFGVAVTRFYCVLSRESSSQAIPYLSTKIRSRTANIDTAPSRHIWPIIGPPSSVWESGYISRQARQGSTPAGECCTSVHTTPKRPVGRSGPSAQRAHRLTVRAGGGTDLGVVVANWDARICPNGSRDKRLHPGLPLVCEGSMLMGFRNGNPSKSGDTLNLLANIEAIGDWRRLVEMSLPEIQDSGHGASISGGQWGSGTGHRAGWQHGTANVGVVCVCLSLARGQRCACLHRLSGPTKAFPRN